MPWLRLITPVAHCHRIHNHTILYRVSSIAIIIKGSYVNLELITAVIHGSHSAEAVLQSLVHLLVPLAVPDHLLLLGKVLALAHWHRAVEVLPVVHVLAGDEAALEARSKALEVAGVVGHPLLAGHHAHPLGGQHVRWQRGHAWRGHVIQNVQKLVKASSTIIERHDGSRRDSVLWDCVHPF